jgi:hypothetical protein
MVMLAEDRSVLFGFHTQYSRTGGSDLLGGAPDWIALPEVRRRIRGGGLGSCTAATPARGPGRLSG